MDLKITVFNTSKNSETKLHEVTDISISYLLK